MYNLRTRIQSTIQSFSISGLSTTVGMYENDERAISQFEKEVFVDYKVVMGGTSFEFESFTPVNTKVRANTTLFLVAKTPQPSTNTLYNVAQNLVDQLFNNKFGKDNVFISRPSIEEVELYYNDKITYAKLNIYNVLYTNDTRTYPRTCSPQVAITYSQMGAGYEGVVPTEVDGTYDVSVLSSFTYTLTLTKNGNPISTSTGDVNYSSGSWNILETFNNSAGYKNVLVVTLTDSTGISVSDTFTWEFA